MPAVMTYATLLDSIRNYLEREDDETLEAEIPTLVLFAQRRIARELKILGLQAYVTGSFLTSNGVIQKPSRWLNTLSINYGSSANTVIAATVTSGGAGYKYAPTVTVTGGSGSGATAEAYLINGVVDQVVITDPGTGYLTTPTLVFSGGDPVTPATGTTTISLTNVERNQLYVRSYEYCRNYWPRPTLTGAPRFYADYGFTHWLIVPTPGEDYPIEIAYYQLAQLLDDSNQTNWLTENAPDLLLYAALLEATPFLKNDERIATWQNMYDRAAQAYKSEDDARMTDRATARKA